MLKQKSKTILAVTAALLLTAILLVTARPILRAQVDEPEAVRGR